MIIAMIGFELIRRSGEAWQPTTCLLMLFLALLASIKFTYLILGSFTVLIVCVQELLQGRWHIALRLAACFLAGFLVLWMACGQSLYNLPIYLYNSWHISQGYQQAMGLPTPGQPFWLGITVLAALSAYGLLYLIRHFGNIPHPVSLRLAGYVYLPGLEAWFRALRRAHVHFFCQCPPSYRCLSSTAGRLPAPTLACAVAAGARRPPLRVGHAQHEHAIRMAQPYLACTLPISGQALAPL